jgi:SAM-dependent methyltransferase
MTRLADHYDAELRLHNERLRAATGIGPTDRVLDIGCGTGQTTRDAARDASAGSALGVDVSEEMLERARRRTAQERLSNVSYELGDAQVHPFQPAQFDVVISRFGTMFFSDPVAAFKTIARASRPGARLVMMVWQSAELNEWTNAIRHSIVGDAATTHSPGDQGAFSLGEPSTVALILNAAGFNDIGFDEIREPVCYGPDTASAFEFVGDFKATKDLLANQGAAAAERATARLRETLQAHLTSEGVLFDSRAWIVSARRSTTCNVSDGPDA